MFSVSASLAAQDIGKESIPDSLVSYPLSEVVITADRGSSNRFNTPEAIEGIRGEKIQEDQMRTAPEALMMMPGVFVQKTNHGGGSPFVRGLTGNQTLLLIDGIRLSNATQRYGPNQYFNTLDVFSLDRIEVLRGSGSVQYGSDALGGTLHALGRDASFTEKPAWGTSLLGRLATRGMEQSLHADLSYGSTKATFRGGLSRRKFGDLVGGDTTGRQTPTGYDEFDFDLKGKIRLGPATTLTLAYQDVHQGDVPVYHKVVLEDYAIYKMDPQNRRLAYLRLNHDLNAGIWKHFAVTGSWQYTDEGREMQKNGSDILRHENDKVYATGFSTEVSTEKGDIWSANSGIELYNDQVKSTRTDTDLTTGTSTAKRGLYPDGSAMTSLAAFTIHRLDFQKWNITAGARWNAFVIQVSDENVGTTRLTPSAGVSNLGLMRKLSRSSKVFASFNSGFRAPNIDDLGTMGIVDFRYETPNFDLEPEHSFQYQAGYKYHRQPFRGEIYIYRNELYDLIVRNRVGTDSVEGYPVYRKENVERAFIQGVEASWNLALSRAWLLTCNLAYTYGQNITKNEPVRRIPPVFGLLALEHRRKNSWYSLECLAAGKQSRLAQGDVDDNRIPDGGTPGWCVVNVAAGCQLWFFTIDLRLNNFLNEDYRYHGSGVNGCGRSVLLTMRFEIKQVSLKSTKSY
jgi:outer membrane cobalamin receptor